MQFVLAQQPTLDVEAAIRDSQLDFGLFGPESRLNGHLAEQMFAMMQQEMKRLTASSSLEKYVQPNGEKGAL